ncbi:response regulator [Roseicella sp. DB1501]|uniref:response regulator n=1 Tax=Roseicella sp. DB1501 TaxID=2730925 RepID=UPI0034A08118
MNILILDDHGVVRRGLRAMLETRADWTVVGEAADGRAGIELARDLQPDVVIIDIAMPKMNGLDATRHLRQVSPKSAVLIFTMVDSEELIREVFSAGARGYLLKSDADRLIMAAVEALAAGKPFLNPSASVHILDEYLRGAGTKLAEQEPLTLREREVAQAICEGLANKEIAHRLGISFKTVESHRASLMRKIHAHSVLDVVRFAERNNITFAGPGRPDR